MPAKPGNTSINVSLPTELVARIDILASKPGVTRSQVVADALRELLEGSANQTLLEGLYGRLDQYGKELKTLGPHLSELLAAHRELRASVDLLRQRFERWVDATPPDAAPRAGVIPFTPRTEGRSTARGAEGVTGWRRLFRYLC